MNIQNNIWITKKVRMEAEQIRRKWNAALNWALSWNSLCLVGFGIVGLSTTYNINIPAEALLFGSVAVLILSLIVTGQNLLGAAYQFRNCYLELDALGGSDISDEEKIQKYHEILRQYPNHSAFDYDWFLFNNIVIRKKTLTDALNKNISFGRFETIRIITQLAIRMAFIVFLFVFPALYFCLFSNLF